MNVTAAMKKIAQGDGIPMIDADGHPRPITLKINAETIISGSGNLMGEKAILSNLTAASAKRKVVQEVKVLMDRKREREVSEGVESDADRKKVKK
jgi:hypothetical protein